MGGLVTEGALVEEVADETEAEDGDGQEVAGYLRIAAESAREELGAVFCGDVLGVLVIGCRVVGLVEFARTNLCEQRC